MPTPWALSSTFQTEQKRRGWARDRPGWSSILPAERLARLEELEGDLRLLSVALARTVIDSGRRYSLQEVVAELGVDLDALAADD